MKKRGIVVVGLAFCAVGVMSGWLARRAFADGIPAANALTYTGLLEDANGTPLTGSKNIQVQLWNAAAGGTTPLCQTASVAITLVSGRFQIQLPDTCTAAIHANQDTWVEVLVEGASLGRTKLGAVPYAVESDRAQNASHAVNADNAAAASGTLATELTQLQSLVHPKSGFNAWSTATVSIPNNTAVPVMFNQVEFDLSDEYNEATGTYTAKQDGYYLFTCALEYVVATNNNGTWQAAIVANGSTQVAVAELSASPGVGIIPQATTILHLTAGGYVQCSAFQISGAAATVGNTTYPRRTSFAGVRLY